MQLVNVIQGTEAWLRFRRVHISASESGSIMGCNPYKSIIDLYEEKIFQFEQDDNPYMLRGRRLEPIALEEFEKETGLTMYPTVVKHDTINWMAASLDGMTINRDAIVEIKCNGKTNHDLAVKGKIPKYHLCQIQHQLACTGLDFAYLFSFDGTKGIILEVKRDQEFIEKMIEKELEFWNCLQTLTPPENTTRTRRRKNATAGAIS